VVLFTYVASCSYNFLVRDVIKFRALRITPQLSAFGVGLQRSNYTTMPHVHMQVPLNTCSDGRVESLQHLSLDHVYYASLELDVRTHIQHADSDVVTALLTPLLRAATQSWSGGRLYRL
jgi:hypothetical protein